jgi:CBS domain-containing protein
MGRVADILRVKGTDVQGIARTATVYDAVVRMVDANVGSILVVEGPEVVGIFTERDYFRRVALPEKAPREITVGDVMSSPVVSVTSDWTLDECSRLMTEERLRHLPVVDDGTLVGIVSIGDVVKAQIAEQTSQIQVLHEYITAR